MKRDPEGNRGGLFPGFHRFYLPAWAWFAGLMLSYLTFVGALFWVQLFAVEGVAV